MMSSSVLIQTPIMCYLLMIVLMGNLEKSFVQSVNISEMVLKENLWEKTASHLNPIEKRDDIHGSIFLENNLFFIKSECNRYCIEKKMNTRNYHPLVRINLGLPLINNSKAETRNDQTYTLLGKNLKQKKCKIYLNLGCDLIEEDESEREVEEDNENHSKKVLFDENEVSGYTKRWFNISESVSGIDIRLMGDLSYVVFQLPSSNDENLEEEAQLAISSARMDNDKGIRLIALRTPPGAYYLKLMGEENAKYHFIISAFTRKRRIRENEADYEINGTSFRLPPVSVFTNLSTTAISIQKRTVDKEQIVQMKLIEKTDISNETEHINENLAKTLVPKVNDTSINYNENFSMKTIDKMADAKFSELEDFSANVDDTINKNSENKILIQIDPNSNLIATTGPIHRIVFVVKNNNQDGAIRCIYRATSAPLKIFNVVPTYSWIEPHSTEYIAVDIEVPNTAVSNIVNTVTLFVDRGITTVKKTTYLYIQNSNSIIMDNVKPTIKYKFNNNCAGKLNTDICKKSRWSVDITVQDVDSGLKSVTYNNNMYPSTEFISGTKTPVTFYYTSTCCSPTVLVTAVDLLNNEVTQTIDVTAWDNLTQGEIAAIVVGALFILLIIILIVLITVYCVRKKKSHDLPYTQRYGSRPPARTTEGTNF